MPDPPNKKTPPTPREGASSPAQPDRDALLDRLLHALDTMQVGLTLTDAGQRILYVNRAEAEMHGYQPEELVGRPASVLAPPEHRRRLSRRDLEEAGSWQRQRENLRKDGSRFPVELLSDVLADGDGRPVGLVTISQDVSERHARERDLRELHERYALAIEGSHDGIWDWDLEAGRVFVSRRWLEMVGLDRDAAPRDMECWLERVHPEDRQGFRAALDAHLAGESEHFEREHRLLHGDGSYRWMLARGVAVRRREEDGAPGTAAAVGDAGPPDGSGRPVRMGGSLTDVTERRVRDPLTGLPNRLLLLDRMEHALERRERSVPGEVAVLFLDLDGFKVVNDSLGHLFGDRVLEAVARRLRETVRGEETLARLGGDEFVVVLEQVDGAGEAEGVARRLHAALETPVVVEETEIFVSSSIGVSLTSSGDAPAAPPSAVALDLLREADTAMYKAKAAGRGQTRVFDESMRSLALEELELGSRLRHALDRGELELHYQPIYAAADRRVVGAEALLRWRHPERGLLAPERFLHLAEESGLIVPIGAWVVERACRQAAAWIRRLPEGTPFAVSVNASPQELVHRDFPDTVRRALRESGLTPGRLRLEVTESTLIRDRPRLVAKLEQLRREGVAVTVDDFGIGYSSLSYLDHLPVDGLKIDRSFVAGIDRLPGRRNMVASILRMAAELGIEVVAEGAETEDQIRVLQALHCLFLQGHALARAEPPERLAERLGLEGG